AVIDGLMRRVGLEPTRPEGQWLLRPSRRPIAPPPRASRIVGLPRSLSGPARKHDRPILKPGPGREILPQRKSEGRLGSSRGKTHSGRTMEEGALNKKFSLLALGVAAAVAAAVAGTTGVARSATASVTPLPSSSCGPIVYKGSGSPDFIVASDLPLQGAIRHQTVQVSRAELWALSNAGWKAGSFKIGYQSCDDS